MKRYFGLLLSLWALAGVAYAGRDGSRDEKSHGGGGAPAGSETFRPAPAPRPQPTFTRPSNPAPERFERPVVKEERHAPPAYGTANVLPSVAAPYHAPVTKEFRPSTTEIRPPTTEFRQPPTKEFRQPLPSGPGSPGATTRSERVEDFLGMKGEQHISHPSLPPNYVPPSTQPPAFERSAVIKPFKPYTGETRVTSLPNPPGRPERGPRPALAPRWQAASNNFTNQFSHWSQANSANLAAFQANRVARWNQIGSRQNGAGWRGQFHTPQYREWRHAAWDFRRHRAEEIWYATQGLYGSLFDDHWWSTCWWRHRPWVVVDVPPWWWWSTPTWADETGFFGPDLGAGPIPYDPGTNVFYDGDTYDVDGNDEGSAADAAQQATDLANAPVDEYPVPEPAPPGQSQEWLPLGAWALTQQEQGDAVLYFQLSVDRSGIIGGGYKNALTGDEQPIIGRLDKHSQRLAWHIANNPDTVFETGLSSLNYDVAGVFVHFGAGQTQNWLLVRLPSPDMPPGPATVPPDTN